MRLSVRILYLYNVLYQDDRDSVHRILNLTAHRVNRSCFFFFNLFFKVTGCITFALYICHA